VKELLCISCWCSKVFFQPAHDVSFFVLLSRRLLLGQVCALKAPSVAVSKCSYVGIIIVVSPPMS
jgi:hypothetical protein